MDQLEGFLSGVQSIVPAPRAGNTGPVGSPVAPIAVAAPIKRAEPEAFETLASAGVMFTPTMPLEASRASSLAHLPQEVLLRVLYFSDTSSCITLRSTCVAFNTTFQAFAWQFLQEQMTFASPSYHPNLTLREVGVLHQMPPIPRTSPQFDEQSPIRNILSPPRQRLHPAEHPLGSSPMEAGRDAPMEVVAESAVNDDDEQEMHSILDMSNVPSCPSAVHGDNEAEERLRKVWLAEMHIHRNIQSNMQLGKFNYTTVEKQSHAEPIVLPNGIVCFTRWQLIAVYVRVQEGIATDDQGEPMYPTGPENYCDNRWIKAGYLHAHADTITSMKFQRTSNTVLTSSFDGTIKRWSVRDDFASRKQQNASQILGLMQTLTPTEDHAFIFCFDTRDLYPPWFPEGDDAFRRNPSLLAAGTENGQITLSLIDKTSPQATIIGSINTHDLRVRDVKFINKHIFVDDFDDEGFQTGTVHIVAITVNNSYLLGQTIKRKRIKVSHNDPRVVSNKAMPYGYEYSVASTDLVMLTPQVPFADVPSTIDVPALFWPYASEFSRYRTAAERETATSFSNIPWLPPYRNHHGEIADPSTTFHAYRGNRFITNPVVIFTFNESSCALASLNVNNPPADGAPVTNSSALPYRWDALAMDTYKATCARWSTDNAFLGVGTTSGNVRLLAARPIRPAAKQRDSPHHSNGANSDIPFDDEAGDQSSDVVERGSVLSAAFTEGSSLLRSLTPSLGQYSNRDFSITAMVKIWTRKTSQNDAHEEDASGFSCMTLQPAHVVPVVNINICGNHLASIDNHANTHVYDLKSLSLIWMLTQYSGVPKAPIQRRSLAERIIALDAASHLQAARHVIIQNGTMLVTPLTVTNHSLIADFTPQFSAVGPDGKPKKKACCRTSCKPHNKKPRTKLLATSDKRHPPSADRCLDENGDIRDDSTTRSITRPEPPKNLMEVRKIRAQPSLFSFHLSYVIFPPIALFVIWFFTLLLALRIDGYIDLPVLATVLISQALGVLPYFLGDLYCHKPMIVHVSGVSFFLRFLADVSYLVVFPILYALKMDGLLFTDVSWLILSVPLNISLVLAVFAAVLEVSYEVRHNIVLWRATVFKQRLTRAINDSGIILLSVGFVCMMSIYFDEPVVDGKPWSSFNEDRLSLWQHVFVPVWALLIYGMSYLPRLLTFNPDPNRLCRSWATYILSLFCLGALYSVLLTLPMIGFVLKYDNYYNYQENIHGDITPAPFANTTTLPPSTIYSGTVSAASRIPLTAIVSPLIVFAILIQIMATANGVVHYKQLVRHAFMLPDIDQVRPAAAASAATGAAAAANAQPAAAAPAAAGAPAAPAPAPAAAQPPADNTA